MSPEQSNDRLQGIVFNQDLMIDLAHRSRRARLKRAVARQRQQLTAKARRRSGANKFARQRADRDYAFRTAGRHNHRQVTAFAQRLRGKYSFEEN